MDIIRSKRQAAGMISALLLILLVASTAPAWAQVNFYGQGTPAGPANRLPSLLDHVKITQRLNQQLPLDAVFRDSTGKQVQLGDYFGKRPVILALVYYQCQMLCSEELSGLVGALEMVSFKPGKDFNVVVVSFDPSEGPALAKPQKALYLRRYARPGTDNGWHFLTGPESSIQALTTAVGFSYVRVPGPDGKALQFAHPSAIEIVTPEGRVAQYFMGVEYSPNDLRLGLVAASHYRIGSPVDDIITYCYRYDPSLDRRSMVVARTMQLGGLLTVLGLGSFMVVNFRRDIKEAAELRARPTKMGKG